MKTGFDRKEFGEAPDKMLKLRNVLNICFIVLALATIVIYLLLPQYRMIAYGGCFLAIAVKMVEVCIRMFGKK